jgi:hypothetical protein
MVQIIAPPTLKAVTSVTKYARPSGNIRSRCSVLR